MNNPNRERITSIDALRAFTLLGILIVHANDGFGFWYDRIQSLWDYPISLLNDLFLSKKCNTIFAVLFGISFYLILRNPKNSSAKFVWRCFILMLIGIFNKLFYTYDALMWYGLWGMLLVIFRNLKPKMLLTTCVCLFLLNLFILPRFNITGFLFGSATVGRYGIDKSFYDVISYRYAIMDYLRVALQGGYLATLVKFLFGYWIAKIGFIEHLQERLTMRLLLISWAVFIVLFVADFLFQKNNNTSLTVFSNYAGSCAYASALIYAYYHSGFCNRILKLFEPYGKLGLTNYSIGGIFGVVFINEFGLGLYKYGLTPIVLFFIAFFLLQAVFSYYWLRYFTYGPMEYLWRLATERKMIPFLRINQVIS